MSAPLFCTWNGEAFMPWRRHEKECDRRFVIGEKYCVTVAEIRSENAHKSYFAAVREWWMSLPDELIQRFPSSEHLRKHALIATGFCKASHIACVSAKDCRELLAALRGMDEYAIISRREDTISIWRAESQNYEEMGKARFDESQQAVRDYVAGLLAADREQMPREASA